MHSKKNVFEKYNIIADWFFQHRNRDLIEKPYLDKLLGITKKGGRVLDIGCGTGVPIMSYLLEQGLQVTGVDASFRMLEITRRNFPLSDLIEADMRQLSLPEKFDAIIAWHSFFHLPAEDQAAMFDIFRNHLTERGGLLFTSGNEHGEAWGMNGGENLFHASLSSAAYQSLLEAHGFRVLFHKEEDPDCGGATVWLAQRFPWV